MHQQLYNFLFVFFFIIQTEVTILIYFQISTYFWPKSNFQNEGQAKFCNLKAINKRTKYDLDKSSKLKKRY